MQNFHSIKLLLLFLAFPILLIAQQNSDQVPKREFRGVWIATVVNIDWPSKQNLNVSQMKQELLQILDDHKSQGMNAIILQVRPTADAFYAKSREPWSVYLSGTQGLAPAEKFDPLAFAIEEAHRRGMELHAWFNPYRASMGSTTVFSKDHITRKKPEWFFNYGGKRQFDPGIPEVRDYIIQVVLDVVKNYDIDGVHLDDYFYPYKIAGQNINDAATYAKYKGDINNIGDWRRANVDSLIKGLNDSVHVYKKHIKFGVSPFGIWRNKREHPEGSVTNGMSNYSELYADSRKWVQEGWVDYINPQIYFTFSRKAAPYATLVDWWSNNTFGKHLYIGQAAYLMNSRAEAAWRNFSEIPNQIRYLRKNNRIQGSVFFSSKSLRTMAKPLADSLRNDFYKLPALPPQMPWLDDIAPNPPQHLLARVQEQGVQLKWDQPLEAEDGETASGYVIYRFDADEELSLNSPQHIIHISYSPILSYTDKKAQPHKAYKYVVTSLDRLKNESSASNEALIQ